MCNRCNKAFEIFESMTPQEKATAMDKGLEMGKQMQTAVLNHKEGVIQEFELTANLRELYALWYYFTMAAGLAPSRALMEMTFMLRDAVGGMIDSLEGEEVQDFADEGGWIPDAEDWKLDIPDGNSLN